MPGDVFISYATEDKITADAVCFGLEKAGLRCWIAPRDILPSDNYDDAIIQAIDDARVMVVIFSSNIFQSQYVKGEVEYAFSKNLIIAPFRIEAITPEGGLKLYLGRKHWLDAWTPPLEDHINKLASTVQSLLATPEPSGEKIPEVKAPVESTPRPATQRLSGAEQKIDKTPQVPQKSSWLSNPRIKLGVGAGTLLLIILAVVAINLFNSGPEQAKNQATPTIAANSVIPTQAQDTAAPEPTLSPTGGLTAEPTSQPTQAVGNTPATSSQAGIQGNWLLLDSLPRNINDFEVDPTNSKTVYAATGDYTGAGGGIYKSEDGGLNWNSVSKGLPNQTVLAITIIQSDTPVLLASLDSDGLYSSRDGGTTWSSLGNPFTGGGQYLTSFDLSGDRKTVFGLVKYLGIVRSDNGGQSWTSIVEGLPKQDNQALVQSVAVDPTNSLVLYAGTGGFVGGGAGVYKSTDGGETWAASNKSMLDYYITSVEVDPSNSQVVFAGSGSGDLFKSTDGGATWSNLTDPLKQGSNNNSPREIMSIQVDPGNGVVYLVAANSGVMFSRDGGNKWRSAGTPPGTNQPQFSCMGVIFGEKPVFMVAIPGVTTANGWRYGEGPVATSSPSQPTAAATPAKAVVVAGTWQNVSDLPRSIQVLAVNPANPKQVFAGVCDPMGAGALYESEDNGVTWGVAAGWTGKGVGALAFSSGPTPTLYATGGHGGEIYSSQDGGNSWTLAGKSPATGAFSAYLVAAPSNPKVVYYVGDPGLAHSDDGGQSWQVAGDGLPTESQGALVLSIAIDPIDAKIVYAGTGGFVGQGQGVFKSIDGGVTWAPANRGMLDYRITELAVDPNQSQVIFAGSGSGDLFKSTDGAKTWTNLTEKLKIIQYGEPREIHSIRIDPTQGIVYLAADNSGVLYSSDGGGKWRALGNPSSLEQPSWTSFSMTFGEKPVMYFGTDGSGVWRFAPNP